MVLPEEHRLPQTVRRCVQVAAFELSQPEVQEQIPISYSKRRGTLIFADLRGSITHHSLGKTQMIMSKRVVGMLAHDLGVETNGLRIVFDTKRIVGADITDCLLVSARRCVGRNA